MKLKIDTYILALWLIILFIIFIAHTPDVPINAGLQIDKLAHFILYGVTALMFLRVLRWNLDRKLCMLFSFLLSSLFGLIIEILQSFTPHRSFELADILANTAGAAVFVIGSGFYNAIAQKKTN